MAKKRKRKLKFRRIVLLMIFITIVILLFLAVKNNKSNSYEKKNHEKNVIEKENELSLIMVGDSLIHSSVYDDAYEDGIYNFDKMLSLISPIVKNYDLAFYNQETILGGTDIGLSSYPSFNSPQEVGDAFINAGFNLVSLANNHTLDRGSEAVISSNNYWKNQRDVLTSGSRNSTKDSNNIEIKEKNGIKYTLLAYTTTTNGIRSENDYYVNVYDEKQVKEDIERVRDKVDLLLVSMHWGEEYSFEITEEQEKIANYLASLGVDIVIGHHPHVIEPIDYVDDTLIIYSLGNFLSGQEGLERRIGLMVSVNIEKNNGDLMISKPTATLTYTNYNDGNVKSNFKVYPFNKVTDSILPGYRSYYDEYMDIITSRSGKVIKSPI